MKYSLLQMSSGESFSHSRVIAYPLAGLLGIALAGCAMPPETPGIHHSTGPDSDEVVQVTNNANGSRDITFQTRSNIHNGWTYSEGYAMPYHQYCEGSELKTVEWTSRGKLAFEGSYPHLYTLAGEVAVAACQDGVLNQADEAQFDSFRVPAGDGQLMDKNWQPPK